MPAQTIHSISACGINLVNIDKHYYAKCGCFRSAIEQKPVNALSFEQCSGITVRMAQTNQTLALNSACAM